MSRVLESLTSMNALILAYWGMSGDLPVLGPEAERCFMHVSTLRYASGLLSHGHHWLRAPFFKVNAKTVQE